MQKKLYFKIVQAQRCLLACLISLFLMSASSFNGVKVNFSGEWLINQTKTNLGDNNFNVVGSKLILEQKDSELIITRFTNGMDGSDLKIIEKMTLDGKENTNIVFNNSPKKSTLTWAEDGKSFTIVSSLIFDNNGEKMEIKSNEVWKMADDGNSFAIVLSSVSGWGELKQSYVFEKHVSN